MAPKRGTESSKRRLPPAKTVEARENQMIALAEDLAEKQLSDGTASAMVITHYLKLGTTRERLEKEKLLKENELLKAKTEAIQSAKRTEELYANALDAMRSYRSADSETEGSNDSDDA